MLEHKKNCMRVVVTLVVSGGALIRGYKSAPSIKLKTMILIEVLKIVIESLNRISNDKKILGPAS